MEKLFSLVPDGVVLDGPRTLPDTHSTGGVTYTGLKNWPDAELIAIGWLPTTVVNPPTDSPFETVTGRDDVVTADSVTTTFTLETDMAAMRAWATEKLVQDSEEARQRFMTPGDIKSAVYREKQAEAADWQSLVDAAASPNPDDFPFLKGRAERLDPLDPDYQAVADEWNARASAWKPIGAKIENLYEGAIEAVGSAATESEIRAALIISWPVTS
jgi:hypothetical protein